MHCSSGWDSTSGILRWSHATPRAAGCCLRGLEEFREHLGGELTITLLRDIGVGEEVHQMDVDEIRRALAWLRRQGGRHLNLGAGVHLTYCSNIHPGESWAEVRANLGRHVLAVRDRLAPDGSFGVGLRLSARAAAELSAPAALAEFKDFLARHRMYVFTVNGFPYGAFHGTRVKEEVYLPDWRDPERLRYTNLLADLLAALLPDDPTIEGSVSTVPGAYKPALAGPGDVAAMVEQLLQHVAHLVQLRARSGRLVSLALEPEPHCFLETIDEVVAFFEGHVHGPAAVARVMELTGLDRGGASRALRDHLGVCLDLCHAAVEFEQPADCVGRLARSGIRVLKMQISAGLRLPRLDPDALQALSRFDDAVYLHQVVQQGPGGPGQVRRSVRCVRIAAGLEGGARMARSFSRADLSGPARAVCIDTDLRPRDVGNSPLAAGVRASGGGNLHMGRAARAVSQRNRRRGRGARTRCGYARNCSLEPEPGVAARPHLEPADRLDQRPCGRRCSLAAAWPIRAWRC